jgi:hypothetical protein
VALTPVVLALSRSGEGTAHRIAAALGVPLHGRAGRVDRAALHFPDALSHIRDLFAAGHPVIGVCAATGGAGAKMAIRIATIGKIFIMCLLEKTHQRKKAYKNT